MTAVEAVSESVDATSVSRGPRLGPIGDPRLARLRWRCRRGMLELDVVLQRFLAAHVASLSDTELDAFERLLQTPDPELLGYVQGTCEPADSGLRQLVAKIR